MTHFFALTNIVHIQLPPCHMYETSPKFFCVKKPQLSGRIFSSFAKLGLPESRNVKEQSYSEIPLSYNWPDKILLV